MTDAVLVVNAGSTSLKFAVYGVEPAEEPPLLTRGVVDSMSSDPHFVAKGPEGRPIDAHEWGEGLAIDHRRALNFVIGWLAGHERRIEIVAAGHRVVLGGERFRHPALVTAEVIDYLQGLAEMEPSHQSYNLLGARALAEDFPGLPQVACFDSSFHRTMPEIAQIYAVPKEARDAGVRHWGYHGISYDYIGRRLPRYAPAARRVVVAHLGGGASMCAMLDGKSVETTMGFAGLTGLPMATRSGDVPVDAIFYLLRAKKYSLEELETALYARAGLLGLSGESGDMRLLQHSENPQAKLSVDYLVHAMTKFVGAYAAILGGLDALIFTAGIGENSPIVRAKLCRRLAWLGLELDEAANAANGPRISTAASRVSAFVIPTDEELMIALHTLELTRAA